MRRFSLPGHLDIDACVFLLCFYLFHFEVSLGLHQMGWLNELSICRPLWEIGGFELTRSKPGPVKAMT